MRQIAKRAGVNLASINYYFDSKQNLLGEVLKRTYLHLEVKIDIFCRNWCTGMVGTSQTKFAKNDEKCETMKTFRIDFLKNHSFLIYYVKVI